MCVCVCVWGGGCEDIVKTLHRACLLYQGAVALDVETKLLGGLNVVFREAVVCCEFSFYLRIQCRKGADFFTHSNVVRLFPCSR